jgi:CTP:molybdopterin cytidylyltransferase MocA
VTTSSSPVRHPTRFAGLILAGGQGRRFGGPKAFARLPDGRTFLAACTGVLTRAGARPLAATLPPRHAGHELPGLRQIPLPDPGMDMLSSLRWGLRHLISDRAWQRIVVLPVDHPLVGSVSIRQLVSARAPAAVPRYRGQSGHPVCLDRDVAAPIARNELDGETLREILHAIGVAEVSVDDAGVVANCNTPEALREALRGQRESFRS